MGYQDLKRRPRSNYFQVYDLDKDNLHEWIVYIIGPPNTFYEGGIYKAKLKFPGTYPMDPPSFQFICTMYHPNVYRDGKVCISILQTPPPTTDNTTGYWRPVLGVEEALLSVVSLLSDPNHDDAANGEAAQEWLSSPESFKTKLKKIAEQSRELVPDDFVIPVCVSSKPQVQSSSSSSSSSSAAHSGTSADSKQNEDEDSDCEEYHYSDMEDDEDADEEHQNSDDDDNNDWENHSGLTSENRKRSANNNQTETQAHKKATNSSSTTSAASGQTDAKESAQDHDACNDKLSATSGSASAGDSSYQTSGQNTIKQQATDVNVNIYRDVVGAKKTAKRRRVL